MIAQPILRNRKSVAELDEAIASCIASAGQDMSIALGRTIRMETVKVSVGDFWEIPFSLGQPQDETVAIYMSVSGDIDGLIMVFFPAPEACQLVEMMRSPKRGAVTSLGTVERSALGEVAKLVGLALCRRLSKGGFDFIRLSPPAVMVQPVSCVLDIPVSEAIEPSRQALVAYSVFSDERRQVKAVLVVAPEMPSLTTVLEVVEKRWESK